MLHIPENLLIYSSSLWNTIVENKNKFYTKSISGYLGYIKKQTAKYSVKGSRLKVMSDFLKIIKPYTENLTSQKIKLGFIWDKLPITEYSNFVDNQKDLKRKHYEICGKLLQDSMNVNYVYEIINNMYNRYGERAKQAERNEGIDWKAVSHAFRAGYQLIEIYKTKNLVYPLKEREFIRDVKLGKFHYKNDNIQEKLDQMLFEVENLSKISDYPETMDLNWINNFIINCYE